MFLPKTPSGRKSRRSLAYPSGYIGFAGTGNYDIYIDSIRIDNTDFGGQCAVTQDFSLDNGYIKDRPKHDAAGNLTYDGSLYYFYDAWNRLVKVQRPGTGGTPPTGSVIATINYDGLNRRIVKGIGCHRRPEELEHCLEIFVRR